MAKRITTKEESQILELYDQGMTVPKICEKTRRAFNTIYRCLDKHGRKYQRKSKKVHVDEADSKSILHYYNQGLTNPEIAEAISLPYYAIRSFMKKNELPSNKRKLARPIYDSENNVWCVHCKRYKALDKFRTKKGKDGSPIFHRGHTCKSCMVKIHHQRIDSNPETFFKIKINSIRRKCKKESIPLLIDVKYLLKIYEKQKTLCFYTDNPLELKRQEQHSRNKSISLDRIIPNKGYVKNNLVLTTYRINSIKRDMTLEEMKAWTPNWHKRIMKCQWINLS